MKASRFFHFSAIFILLAWSGVMLYFYASGRVDAILLTGALARSDLLTDWIEQRVRFIAPVRKVPTHEMDALAAGTLAVLNGEDTALIY